MHTVLRPSASRSGGAPLPTARVAVAGATGYTGQELLRLLARHPGVVVTAAMASGATTAVRRLPALVRVWDGVITPLAHETLARETDVVFLALPDAAAAELAPALVDAGVRVVDLSGAFRLRDAGARARWYPQTRHLPNGVAYGLTERERNAVAGAQLVANPGCYPTAALLALAPLAEAGLLVAGSEIVVDAKSGVSGAGKTPSERTHFSECHGNLSAYGVFGHRHGAEIEQGVAAASEASHALTFVPHLVPLDRGLLSTIYLRVAPGTTEEMLGEVFERAYADAPFVRLAGSSLPEIKHVAHTNFCDIGWRVDPSGRAVLVSVIDNLLKGASGQAVQNMNVMLGLDERTGLL
ncbi:MAG: N-acetyl-gamma-glutamyl-phosphate reductase [Acidobacteria bacterium]|nr:MAG: N-acetyl-gamma-glutamyl-phosphate reductase [Acidobacteriota bacterium]